MRVEGLTLKVQGRPGQATVTTYVSNTGTFSRAGLYREAVECARTPLNNVRTEYGAVGLFSRYDYWGSGKSIYCYVSEDRTNLSLRHPHQ